MQNKNSQKETEFFSPEIALIEIPATEIITLSDRAERIRKLQADVQRGIIEIGHELIAAKKEIGHGGWSDWLKNEFEWTQQTANRFMRVAERFGKLNNVVQFKSSTLQAMLLLPLGDEENFIEAQVSAGKPIENQSAREVQSAVKDWNQAKAEEISSFEDFNGTIEWYTPSEIITAARLVLGRIDLDPASSAIANETVRAEKFFSAEDDGLEKEWFGRIWLNPPYAREMISQFVDKLLASDFEAAIVLTDAATETRWFRKLADKSAAIVFTTGRINFLKGGKYEAGTPTRGQSFFYFGAEPDKFCEVFQKFGWCAKVITRSLS